MPLTDLAKQIHSHYHGLPKEGALEAFCKEVAEKFEGTTGLAAILAAGLGASLSFDHADAGSPLTILASVDTGDRAVIIIIQCTEALAGDTPATAEIGQTGTTDKFADNTDLSGMSPGDVLIRAGTLTDETALLATYTAGSGGGEAGAFAVTVLALPEAA